jgi:SAM-dependent methyltransferase
MADGGRADMYATAWHGEQEYDPKEMVRLEKCCRAIRDHSNGSEGRYRLLDVGCGVGPLRTWLGEDGFDITGLELSESAAAIAADRYDRCFVGDVEQRWSVDDAAMDGVHAGAVLEHVVDWHGPLNEANRVLVDGGLLVVAVPNLGYWKERKRLLLGRYPHWTKDMGHLHVYTAGFLRELLTVHGFEVRSLQADRLNLPLLPEGDWFCGKLAGWGSVLIAEAVLARRTRVEDESKAHRFPTANPVALRSIEVPLAE